MTSTLLFRIKKNIYIKKNTTLSENSKIKYKIVTRDKIDIPNTQIHDNSLSWLGTGTSIANEGVKLVAWSETFPPREKKWSWKCFHK
jgi:hypothetical protein